MSSRAPFGSDVNTNRITIDLTGSDDKEVPVSESLTFTVPSPLAPLLRLSSMPRHFTFSTLFWFFLLRLRSCFYSLSDGYMYHSRLIHHIYHSASSTSVHNNGYPPKHQTSLGHTLTYPILGLCDQLGPQITRKGGHATSSI